MRLFFFSTVSIILYIFKNIFSKIYQLLKYKCRAIIEMQSPGVNISIITTTLDIYSAVF